MRGNCGASWDAECCEVCVLAMLYGRCWGKGRGKGIKCRDFHSGARNGVDESSRHHAPLGSQNVLNQHPKTSSTCAGQPPRPY
jgi:hypothetical protein